jgi:hypothetical protein
MSKPHKEIYFVSLLKASIQFLIPSPSVIENGFFFLFEVNNLAFVLALTVISDLMRGLVGITWGALKKLNRKLSNYIIKE